MLWITKKCELIFDAYTETVFETLQSTKHHSLYEFRPDVEVDSPWVSKKSEQIGFEPVQVENYVVSFRYHLSVCVTMVCLGTSILPNMKGVLLSSY